MLSSKSHHSDCTLERHVVLLSPDVHWNTGNIGRTCLGTGARLHLIRPLGFSLESKELKRAGLDYWHRVKLFVWDNFQIFMEKMSPEESEIALFSKNGDKPFWDMPSSERMFLVFGSETKGIPGQVLADFEDSLYHIPSTKEIRSLNLSTAVGIALYESLRAWRPDHEWLA